MKNILKKTGAVAIVLAVVVSCTCGAFAMSWKDWGKNYGNTVEKAAEQAADAYEKNAEDYNWQTDTVDGYVSNVLDITNNLVGSILGGLSA